MKLEPNMYVRTKHNGIKKILALYVDAIFTDSRIRIEKKDISVSSYNIIKVLKVGDFLDNHCIIEILENTCYTNDGWFISADDIEDLVTSICTKEQFESMSYRLGD